MSTNVLPAFRAHFVYPKRVVPTDDAFVNAVSTHVRKCASDVSTFTHMYVETAGGEPFPKVQPLSVQALVETSKAN